MPFSRTTARASLYASGAFGPAHQAAGVTIVKIVGYGPDGQPAAPEHQFLLPWAVMTATVPPVNLAMFPTWDEAYVWTQERSLALQ
jgi:hypothetical protein